VTNRQQLVHWAVAILAAVLAAVGARYGIVVPPPPVVEVPIPQIPAPVPPPAAKLDPLGAIMQIARANVGCSATVIGPRRVDGTYWVISAAHCTKQVGEHWTGKLRNGRTVGLKVVNINRTADYAWMLTEDNGIELPYTLLADSTPAPGGKVWHAGYGVDVPGNREDGTVTAAPNSDGQTEFRISVSSGDSGGGIIVDDSGRWISCVCCTTARGSVARVWGSSVEAARKGQVALTSEWSWQPMEVPIKMPPEK